MARQPDPVVVALAEAAFSWRPGAPQGVKTSEAAALFRFGTYSGAESLRR
jgi:hypothetical protein